MSKKWIWNLKKINMDESMCRTHTQDHHPLDGTHLVAVRGLIH